MGTLELASKIRFDGTQTTNLGRSPQASDVVWALSAHRKPLAHHAPAAPHAYLKDPKKQLEKWKQETKCRKYETIN